MTTGLPISALQKLAQQSAPDPQMPVPQASQGPQVAPNAQDILSSLPQMAQQSQQPDALDTLKQNLVQQYQANTPPKPSGGPIRHMLQNFFSGMGQSMMKEGGLPTPYDKQQAALRGIDSVTTAQSNLELHKMMAGQYAPVPLVGLDGKPITDPSTGKVINLPANHAGTFYAGQAAAASRITVQGMKGDTATEVQGMKNDATQAQHPIQQLMNDAAQAYASGDTETYKNKLAELGQLQGTGTAAARQDKLDQFHQTQQYNVWKTNQDNQTKLSVAQMGGNKAPAAMMQTAAFAQSGLNRLDDAEAAMQRLEARGVLGNVASNKLEDWLFGKGLVDPTLPAQDKKDIGILRSAATYSSSAAMRAHTGRSSHEIYSDFKNTMGINQGSDAWKGAMQETRSMLNDYAQGATNAAVQKLRGTGPSTLSSPQSGQGNSPSVQFTEGSDVYNIPANLVQNFKAKHPQAVPSGR